jgi:hypothetical protein
MPPAARKPPKRPPLFLVTGDNDKLDSQHVAIGKLALRGKEATGAHDANAVAYWRLTNSCSDYLQQARLWPATPYGGIMFDETWSTWRGGGVEVAAPIGLETVEAWQLLVASGLKKKPRRKTSTCALLWPAIKGYVEPLRVLLDAGIEAGGDDPLTGAAAFHHEGTAKLLAERGFDVARSIKMMERYKNEEAVQILRAL